VQPTKQEQHFLAGLDGIRALAVIAVLLYHAGFGWARGGLLGVEIFFVLSGYLITTLLVREYAKHGTIRLRAFWMRRARRLLPALFAVLAVTLTVWVFFLPGQVASIRGDAAAAAGYVTNWWFIIHHQSYFQLIGRPSPFEHLWSLAIEEQFYLLWPLLLLLGRRHLKRVQLATMLLFGAVVSLALMALLYRPEADPSLVYYGTDTRASGLLIGAALALFTLHDTKGREKGPTPQRQGAGLLALAVLLYACWRWGQYSSIVYRGGFGVVDVATAALIWSAVTQPRGAVARVLETPVLRWIGLRSYGIYLWHWPIYTLTRPGLDLPGGEWLPLLIRVVATLLVAEVSYRYLEMPIRTGALTRGWRRLRAARGEHRRRLTLRWVGASSASACAAVVLGAAVAGASPATAPSYLSSLGDVDGPLTSAEPLPHASPSAPESPTPSPTPTQSSPLSPAATPQGAPSQGPSTPPPPLSSPASSGTCSTVSAIGDSVLLGALPAVRQVIPQLQFADAKVGMQVSMGINILRERAASGQVGCVVIVALGSNGTFTTKQFDTIMSVLSNTRHVVFVNVKVPDPWEAQDNEVIAQGVRRYSNASEVDWLGATRGRPDIFYKDGIHPNPTGQKIYAQLVAQEVDHYLAPVNR
jgi:peptidoglycan/LPS O-acetylase OafA/YrhL